MNKNFQEIPSGRRRGFVRRVEKWLANWLQDLSLYASVFVAKRIVRREIKREAMEARKSQSGGKILEKKQRSKKSENP